MAVTDFRVSIGYTNHPKIKLLIAELGFEAAWAHLTLIEYCAINRPSGSLVGMKNRLIATASNWKGDAEEYVSKLASEDIRLLDKCENGYTMHDWEEHQPWVIGALERSERARNAGLVSAESTGSQRVVNGQSTGRKRRVNSSPILSYPNTKPPISPKGDYSVEFEEFWKTYPRHDAKRDGYKAWQKIPADMMPVIINALDIARKSPSWTKDNGTFIPYLVTWLNAKRWEDEPSPPPPPNLPYEPPPRPAPLVRTPEEVAAIEEAKRIGMEQHGNRFKAARAALNPGGTGNPRFVVNPTRNIRDGSGQPGDGGLLRFAEPGDIPHNGVHPREAGTD